MTGAGTSGGHGYPDYGLLTRSEMAANAERVVDAVSVPVIADADTGYGNELNVIRTVRAYTRAGVAALHIEDQTFPKRCGHLGGKEVVPRDEWLRKIRAAAEERPDPALVVIARTDARAVVGFDEALERANRALDVGADMVFVEAPETLEEIEAIPRSVRGPCLFNVVPAGRSPEVSLERLDAWGYRLAILPAALLGPVVAACDRALDKLAGSLPESLRASPALSGAGLADGHDGSPVGFFRRAGSGEWDRARERYSALEEAGADS
jgi:2-methylisocitrate lyase-like PEP mutase family enzyme